jgi:hypothetical protein
MILGMSTATFSVVHVIISLIGIVSGLLVLWAMLSKKPSDGWTAIFLASTVLTSVTGFFFPIVKIGPPHIFGVISLVLLAAAILALYVYRVAGYWRWVYVVGAMISLYLNILVGVIQAFQKLPFLAALAPTQSEAPFVVVQLVVLIVFVALAFLGSRRFPPPTAT